MKFRSAISFNVSGAIELGVAALRAMVGLQPELVSQTSPNRPNSARNLAAGTNGLDLRLDDIRRAGL